MIDIIHAQTVLAREDLERLKKKSGISQTKKALQAAVDHYLKCNCIDEVKMRKETEKEVR